MPNWTNFSQHPTLLTQKQRIKKGKGERKAWIARTWDTPQSLLPSTSGSALDTQPRAENGMPEIPSSNVNRLEEDHTTKMSSRRGTARSHWSGWREGCGPPTARCRKERQLSVMDPDDSDQTQPRHVTINKTTQQRKKIVVPCSNRNNKCRCRVRHTQERKHLSCGWPPHQYSLSGGGHWEQGGPAAAHGTFCPNWEAPLTPLSYFRSSSVISLWGSPYASHYGQP